MLREACLENMTLLKDFIDKGIDRVELCDNLAAGGTTPSLGVIETSLTMCNGAGVELALMIRPRGGDFVYSKLEKHIMEVDMCTALMAGVKRLVVGSLTSDKKVDFEHLRQFIEVARTIKPDVVLTFHMAFDNIGLEEDKLKAMEEFRNLGIDTILTHGSNTGNNIFENVDRLKAYIKKGEECGIKIMAGGGLNFENKDELIKLLPGLSAVHGTKIEKL